MSSPKHSTKSSVSVTPPSSTRPKRKCRDNPQNPEYLYGDLDSDLDSEFFATPVTPHSKSKIPTTTTSTFRPILTSTTHTLILGTAPSTISNSKLEYFANTSNSFWHIVSLFTHVDKSASYEDRLNALLSKGYGLGDVYSSVSKQKKSSSLDKDILHGSVEDIESYLLSNPNIKRLVFHSVIAFSIFSDNFLMQNQDMKFMYWVRKYYSKRIKKIIDYTDNVMLIDDDVGNNNNEDNENEEINNRNCKGVKGEDDDFGSLVTVEYTSEEDDPQYKQIDYTCKQPTPNEVSNLRKIELVYVMSTSSAYAKPRAEKEKSWMDDCFRMSAL